MSVIAALKALNRGHITEFRKAIKGELFERAHERVESSRIAIAHDMFNESGASPNEKAFRAMHSVRDMTDCKPYNAASITGKPPGISKAPKRPADGDEEGNPDIDDDEEYAKNP